ncbi:MAG: hypothetical protein FJZ58_05305, partial [Chlamydiae bacterium]|nr:hypothetical protein [Chlamydiota bacterium]
MQNISDVNSSSLGNIVHQQEKSSAVPALFYATVGGAQETQSYSSSSLRTIAREDLTGLTKKTDKIYFTKSLRHIPQEELHALLDKMGEALSLLEDWRSCRDAVDAFRSFPSSLQTGETARVIAFYFAKENSPPDNAELYRRHIIQYFQDDLPIKDKNVEVWTASAKVFYHEGDSHAPVHRALTRKDIALDNRARIVLNIAAIITRETQSKQVQLFIRHFALLSLEEQKEVSLLGQTYEQQMQISPEKRMEIFAYILGHVSPTKMIPVLRVVRWLFCGASLDSLYLGSNIEALAKYIEIEDSLQKISTLWQDIPNPIDRRVLLDALLLRPPVSSILHSLQFTEKVLEKLEEEQRQPWRRTIFVLHELSIENPALQQFLSLHGETLMNENGSKLLDPSLQAEVSWILLQEFCGGYAGIGDRLFFLAQERKMSFGLLFQEIDRLGYGVFSWPHAKEAYTLAEKMHSVEERVECIHSLLPCKRWGEESTLSQVNTIPGLVTAKEVFQACSILDLLGPALADRAVALLIRSPIVLQEDSSLIDFLDHFLLEFPESKQEFFQRVRFLLGDISIPAKDKKKRAQFLMQGSALERFGNTMLFQIIALLAEAEDKTIESVMSASSFTNLCHQRGDSVLCLLFQMPDKYRERPEKYFYSCNRTIIDENEIYHDMLTLSLFSTKEDKQKVAQLLREKAKLQDLDPCFLFSPEGGFSLQDFLAHMTAFLSEYSSTFAELSLKAYPWLQFLLEHQTVFVITQKTYPLLWEKKQACLHAIYERDIEPFIPEQERSLVIKELVLGFFNQGNDAFFLHRHLKKILPMVPKERRTKDFFLAYTKLFADIRDEETAEALWGLWSSWGAQGSVLVEKMTPLIQASQDAKERFSLVSKVLQETTGSQPVRTVEGLTQIVVPLLLGLEQLEDKQTLIHDVAATEFLYVTPESSKFVLFLIGESASREERIGMLIILEKLKFVEVISAVQHSLEEALSRLPIEEHKRWKIPLFLLLAFREIAGGKKDVALTCYYELIQQVDKSFFETEIQSFHVQKILLSILEKCTSQEEVVGWNFLVQQAAKGYEPWEPSLLFTHLVHCLCGEAKQTIHNLFFLARKSGYAVGSEEYSTILEESYFIGKQRRICEHLGEIFPLKEEVTPAIMPHALHSVFQIFSVVIPEHRPQIVMPLRALLLSSFSKNTTGMDLLVEILKSGVYTEAFRKSIIMGILKDLIEGGGYSRQMFIKFILHADNPLALSSTNPLRLLMNDLLEEDDSFIGRVRLLLKYGSSFQEKLSSLSCVFDTQKQIRKALVARIEVIMKELHDRNGSPCNGQLFSLVETFSILPEELWAEAQTAIFAYPSLVHRGIFGDLLTNIPAWIPRCRDHLLILLQSQTLPMRARVLAKFVIKWQDVLGVQEEHPLIQSCIEILYVTDPEGVFLEENPYR